MLGFGLLLLIGLTVFVVWVVGTTAWALTHPQRRTYAWAVARNIPGDPHELNPAKAFESWSFKGTRFDLPVWEIVGDDPDGATLIITHGWNESRAMMLPMVAELTGFASRIVVWDLPGHGDAPGICRLGTDEHRDLISLIEQLGTDVVLYGRSLGAGVSIRAAIESDRVVGVIAEAPYNTPPTPARNVMKLMGMPHTWNVWPAFLLLGLLFAKRPTWAWFDRRDQARGLRVPLTVIHPELDAICPIEDGRTIAEAGNGRFVQIDGTGHNGLWSNQEFSPRMRKAAQKAIRAISTSDTVVSSSRAST